MTDPDRPQEFVAEVPEDWWRDPRKLAAAALALLLGGAVVVGAALKFARSAPPAGSRRTPTASVPTTRAEPSEPGSAPGSPGTSEPRSSVAPSQAPRGGTTSGSPVPSRRPAVAYRLAGGVWTASADGTGAREVTATASGAFSLSPDGTLLALSDPVAGLSLFPSMGGAPVRVGTAAPSPAAWAPDGSWLAFVGANGAEVWTVRRDGSGLKRLGVGWEPAVAPDGHRVAVIVGGSPGEGGALHVLEQGQAPRPVASATGVVDVAWAGERLLFSTAGDVSGGSSVWSVRPDGADRRRVVGSRPLAAGATYTRLSVSPDGRLLLLAAAGDDGYSRAAIARVDGSGFVQVPSRRDTWPLGWSPRSDRVFLTEGNAVQGERTQLVSVLPDGSGRTELVPGARP